MKILIAFALLVAICLAEENESSAVLSRKGKRATDNGKLQSNGDGRRTNNQNALSQVSDDVSKEHRAQHAAYTPDDAQQSPQQIHNANNQYSQFEAQIPVQHQHALPVQIVQQRPIAVLPHRVSAPIVGLAHGIQHAITTSHPHPVFIAQQPIIPQAIPSPLLLANTPNYPVPAQHPTFSSVQQLLHYYNTNPQAKLQLLQSYQNNPVHGNAIQAHTIPNQIAQQSLGFSHLPFGNLPSLGFAPNVGSFGIPINPIGAKFNHVGVYQPVLASVPAANIDAQKNDDKQPKNIQTSFQANEYLPSNENEKLQTAANIVGPLIIRHPYRGY